MEDWLEKFSDRDKQLIKLAVYYATNHANAGVPGHNFFMVIAALVKELDSKK